MSKREDQPKAAPPIGAGVAGRNRPAEVGGGERQFVRSQGGTLLPQEGIEEESANECEVKRKEA